tara:strand:- start:314 stop:718 length:405 start_codon:yes stop_codon:yes gene_type:complete
MIEIDVNINPKAQARHRTTKSGHTYDPSAKDKKILKYKLVKFKPKIPFAGDIMIKVIFTIPYKKYHYRTGKYKHLLKDDSLQYVSTRPDLDNYIKLLLDCLNKDFFCDDSQVVRIQAEKIYGRKGKIEAIIEEI